METTVQIEELLKSLRELADDKRLYPFPSEDCQLLFPERGDAFQEFTGLLGLYAIDLGGYAKYPQQLLSLSVAEREAVTRKFQKDFFESYPHFKHTRSLITELRTPTLFFQLVIFEKMRIRLLDLLKRLKVSEIEKS
jgi:hypothetical protein